MIKISVIIPVYNAEKYIKACLDSVINQTLKEIEIIIINDGSNDNSLNICNEYKKNDCRIKILDKENKGVSSARNLGINAARGEYLMFIDSDDWVDNCICENLYNIAKKEDSELSICNYVKEDLNFKELCTININKDVLCEKEIKEVFLFQFIERNKGEKNHNLSGFRSSWGKIYKRSTLNYYNIRFDERLAIGEDFLFNLNFLQKIKKVTFDKQYYYHYRTNFSSVTMKYKQNCWELYEEILKKLEEFLNINGIYYENRHRFYKLSIKYFFICLNNEFKKENKKNLFNKYMKLKYFRKNKYIRNALIYENFEDYNLKEKIILFLFKYKQYWLINAIKYIKTLL